MAKAKTKTKTEGKAFEEALARLEALPHLNYTEAKDVIVAVFKAL